MEKFNPVEESCTINQLKEKDKKRPKIMSLHENKALTIQQEENWSKIFDCRKIYIKNKGRMVAHAKWENGNLVITKVKRPKLTNFKIGDVLYATPEWPSPPPNKPPLKTEGWLLIRYNNYDSSRTSRDDPFWKTHQGWFIIPEKINDENALKVFLETYPEVKEGGYQIKRPSEVDTARLKMADYEKIDNYAMGKIDDVPQLYPFIPPSTEDMVYWRGKYCWCGCGKFEYWTLWWANKWVVYEPRQKSNELISDTTNGAENI